MFNRQADEQLYFSTKVEHQIDKVSYRPSICYPVPQLATQSLEKYAARGDVTFYKERVRFVNGAVAKAPATQAVSSVPSVVRSEESNKTSKRKNR